ncbi:MAG: DegT/DnrJ/EryC1/StrS family aminotransferase [Chitinophagaceae bacterium]|nr:DegT/DnrJ/EryC1/StrS family aminotransferase [Chitinophagaceae bacterium]
MIPVTKPFLPPIEQYEAYIRQIWDRNWLTNNGPLVNELELKLKEYLSLPHLLFVTNGTVAIQLAIKALGLQGDIITTPFSYVATTSSIVWEGCAPVFCDIDPETLNIDAGKIEDCITDKTVAILATHTYGNACDIESIQQVAEKHKLKVIYDAAHCFGTKYKGESIFKFGDISTASFHATKLFHTIEGGAVITNNPDLLRRMAYMRNFGHNGPEDFAELGINGKNSEFHAAMGLINLKYVQKIIEGRKRIVERYTFWLQYIKAKTIRFDSNCDTNYSYFPLLFETEEALLKAKQLLEGHWVYPRRYFYPALNTLRYLKTSHPLPVCDDVSRKVLCLPVYDNLSEEEIDFACRIILRAQNN